MSELVGERIVRCPGCGEPTAYSQNTRSRPLCSARCKGLDLGDWASENFRVPADAPPDDEPFGDPKLH